MEGGKSEEEEEKKKKEWCLIGFLPVGRKRVGVKERENSYSRRLIDCLLG
jgi:hypothetical protein